ncbi:hypothetical protein ATO13_18590 [Stappia sp. 22II-S9-Z10]|nr:hypothetical protein ATO13_18590 [Stappia sp. 22II-S9-Z10]
MTKRRPIVFDIDDVEFDEDDDDFAPEADAFGALSDPDPRQPHMQPPPAAAPAPRRGPAAEPRAAFASDNAAARGSAEPTSARARPSAGGQNAPFEEDDRAAGGWEGEDWDDAADAAYSGAATAEGAPSGGVAGQGGRTAGRTAPRDGGGLFRRRGTARQRGDARSRREAEPIAVPEARGAAVVTPEPLKRRRRWSWLGLFTAGISGLTGLALTVSLFAFVEDLFARGPWLGYLAASLAVLATTGLVGMILREWLAIRHLKVLEDLRRRADDVITTDDPRDARAVITDLISTYEDRPTLARGRKSMKGHMREVIDGRDLIALGEREMLAQLDRQAVTQIVSAARRVAAVTALSPRALVDVGYVIFASLSMVRQIATIYGGRPGTLGFLRVLRHAIAHLAVTGGMAATDSLIGEVIGKGIAAKLSARLGEGIVNGLMTARLGLAALDVLRPLPFHGTRRPRINDVMSEIAKIAPKDDK